MPQQPQVESPEWWRDRLHAKLAVRRPAFRRFDAYYEGEHKLAFATQKFREAFGSLFSAFADNFCDLVVDAVAERLNPEGFRFGSDPEADKDAWRIWQENNLDAGSNLLHTEALVNGLAYTLIQPGPDDRPQITIESPQQCIVAYEPGTKVRAAGLKEWWDDWTGYTMATVYLPDGIYKYQSTKAVKEESLVLESSSIRWAERRVENEQWPLPNPLDDVPLICFENRPRLLRPGRSEIATVIPVQDAINKLCADLMVGSEFQAYRQRVLMGAEVPIDPITNQPVEAFKHAISRLWMIESPDARVFEFSTIDLGNFTKAIEMYVSHIASQTRTPPHYFERPGGQFPSGESIKSAETGLVAKTRQKMRFFGESWEDTMRLAFAVLGDVRKDEMAAETIWGDPESRSESQHIDALVKKQAIGVPNEQLQEDAGYTPAQIERFKTMTVDQAIDQALLPNGAGNGSGG